MNRPAVWLFGFVLGAAGAASFPAYAQPVEEEPGEERSGELRREMRRYFSARLRAELALTDEQMKLLEPEFDALESSRVRHQRERREIGGELRDALRGGAGDAEIERLLVRFDDLALAHEKEQRERLRRIDASLSVRQRAELRFFLTRFRQDMERRVREFRDQGRAPRRSARP
jgi:hypothetical protein